MVNYYDDIGFDPWLSFEECCKTEIGLKYFGKFQWRVGDTVFVGANWVEGNFGKLTSIDLMRKVCFVSFSGNEPLEKIPLSRLGRKAALSRIRLPVAVFTSYEDTNPRHGEIVGSRNRRQFFHVRFEDRSVELDIPNAHVQLMTFDVGNRVKVLQQRNPDIWRSGTVEDQYYDDDCYVVKLDDGTVKKDVHVVLIRLEASLFAQSKDFLP
jgi:hypothetical protein